MRLRTLTVSELNRYLKKLLTMDPILNQIYLRGEISNFKNHGSGHFYFSLKDETSKINCVMFRENCMKIKFEPYNGLNVIVKGYVSLFERDGQYQLYINEMEPEGIGALYVAFEQLKEKLEREGLFQIEHKKKIPVFPRRIAVVTSPTGAAIQDILSVVKRRNSFVDILLYPVLVQGEGAGNQIAAAIQHLNQIAGIDAIIAGRGGGSIEELWAFNEEIVARSIFSSQIPVISAVGHETDFTIADFVADLRAPTPSAAAELAVPNLIEVKSKMDMLHSRIRKNLQYVLYEKRSKLQSFDPDRIHQLVTRSIHDRHQLVDSLYQDINLHAKNYQHEKRLTLEAAAYKLEALNPLATLRRGYAVTMDLQKHKALTSIEEIHKGDNINIMLSDGCIACTVDNIVKGEGLLDGYKL
ncbi:exodeoxyribonuclease VII large subunit [Geosporobacter ferrireducens]|uniref:Exodeoxyribonuclease 7 large subunit n=1 Tax=Geosporobacter ferrireducens TaxID=1424294 RepID=A0A1D8GB68_9FIRM|nr:exodeoxyribonuclease VII large subunit [Geosporobacter ferrireducens]AOT68151.1 exodeoxyribonuclease VII large subunit [Geosporobacter ferrireducens]MTI54200.1 exodeoxyribonuclease VII large subunit [Geosporobacter ferrireducens]